MLNELFGIPKPTFREKKFLRTLNECKEVAKEVANARNNGDELTRIIKYSLYTRLLKSTIRNFEKYAGIPKIKSSVLKSNENPKDVTKTLQNMINAIISLDFQKAIKYHRQAYYHDVELSQEQIKSLLLECDSWSNAIERLTPKFKGF